MGTQTGQNTGTAAVSEQVPQQAQVSEDPPAPLAVPAVAGQAQQAADGEVAATGGTGVVDTAAIHAGWTTEPSGDTEEEPTLASEASPASSPLSKDEALLSLLAAGSRGTQDGRSIPTLDTANTAEHDDADELESSDEGELAVPTQVDGDHSSGSEEAHDVLAVPAREPQDPRRSAAETFGSAEFVTAPAEAEGAGQYDTQSTAYLSVNLDEYVNQASDTLSGAEHLTRYSTDVVLPLAAPLPIQPPPTISVAGDTSRQYGMVPPLQEETDSRPLPPTPLATMVLEKFNRDDDEQKPERPAQAAPLGEADENVFSVSALSSSSDEEEADRGVALADRDTDDQPSERSSYRLTLAAGKMDPNRVKSQAFFTSPRGTIYPGSIHPDDVAAAAFDPKMTPQGDPNINFKTNLKRLNVIVNVEAEDPVVQFVNQNNPVFVPIKALYEKINKVAVKAQKIEDQATSARIVGKNEKSKSLSLKRLTLIEVPASVLAETLVMLDAISAQDLTQKQQKAIIERYQSNFRYAPPDWARIVITIAAAVAAAVLGAVAALAMTALFTTVAPGAAIAAFFAGSATAGFMATGFGAGAAAGVGVGAGFGFTLLRFQRLDRDGLKAVKALDAVVSASENEPAAAPDERTDERTPLLVN